MEESFKGRLNPEFIHRNVLIVRVAALASMKKTSKHSWNEYIHYNIERLEKYGTDTTNLAADALEINNFVWEDIFLHSSNPDHFRFAIQAMKGVIRRNPTDYNNYDTYANVLYKAGRTDEAIRVQQEAIYNVQIQCERLANFQNNLDKMKKGEPTWVESPQ